MEQLPRAPAQVPPRIPFRVINAPAAPPAAEAAPRFPAGAPGPVTARSGFGFYICEMGRDAHIATLLRVGAGIKNVKGFGNYKVDYKCR